MKEKEMERLADFIQKSRRLRAEFGEHAREIDRAIFLVLQKVDCCNEPKCECNKSFEQFHAEQNAVVEKLRKQSERYEFN